MRPRRAIGALIALLFPLLSFSHAFSSTPAHPRVGLVARDGVLLRSRPDPDGRVLATLVQQTQVEVLGSRGRWLHVAIWASAHGWLASNDVVFRPPWFTPSTYHAPEVHTPIRPYGPAPIHVMATVLQPSLLRKTPSGGPVRWLASGSRIAITAWLQDRGGKVWYATPGGWVVGDAVLFPAHSRPAHNGPNLGLVAGKGMWLTLGTAAAASPSTVVKAARKDGITHLYVEAAISPLGFHGRGAAGPLIEAAHRQGIAVIAWVYPYLLDVAADVTLTTAVARYRSAGGQAFDGIAADLETNVQLWNLRAYSQLVRLALGDRYLLVGVTYPPQSLPDYPFAEAGRYYDVLAPMDYWHQTRTDFGLDYDHMRYGWTYGYRYAADSIAAIRRAAGNVPIEPIGQTFDNFGRLEMGPYAPSADEVRGFLAGCKAEKALGASFFQWMTTTEAEWQVVKGFAF